MLLDDHKNAIIFPDFPARVFPCYPDFLSDSRFSLIAGHNSNTVAKLERRSGKLFTDVLLVLLRVISVDVASEVLRGTQNCSGEHVECFW